MRDVVGRRDLDDEAAPDAQVLDVDVVEGRPEESRPFFLFERGVPGQVPLVLEKAINADDAVEGFLLPDLAATTPFPPWKNGAPVAPRGAIPEMLAAVASDGREFLVGEVDWPRDEVRDHADIWLGFTEKELGVLKRVWQRLRRRL